MTEKKKAPAPKKSEPPKSNVTENAENQALPSNPVLIIAQYLKDSSFENPNVPEILSHKENPEVAININISINNVDKFIATVDLTVKAESKLPDGVQFLVEITYGALVKLHNDLDEKFFEPLLKVEVPRLLFPFIRNILADTTRDGGFPPLFMQPIDFGELYRAQLNEAMNEASKDVPKH